MKWALKDVGNLNKPAEEARERNVRVSMGGLAIEKRIILKVS
jgi:hypothetical protein